MNTPRTNSVIHDGNEIDIHHKCDDLSHYMNMYGRMSRHSRDQDEDAQ